MYHGVNSRSLWRAKEEALCGAGLTGALVATTLLSPAVSREVAFLCTIGFGEKISYLRELPADTRESGRAALNGDVAIGLLYEHLYVFWFDLWTWNGRYVMYRGNRYWPLTDDNLVELLGPEQFRSLGKPLAYRFPTGLSGIVACTVLCIAYRLLFPSEVDRARRLQKNPRYREAFKVYTERLAKSADRAKGELGAFSDAVEYLRSQGEPADEAEANIRLLVKVTPQPLRPRPRIE
jgi:hypothetical protein